MSEMAPAPLPGETQIALFRNKEIRKVFHEGEWFFSIVDIVEAVTDSPQPSRYWTELRTKLIEEGHDQLFASIEKLAMPGADGRERGTDAANTETIFRIIQSVPSPKAETFKRWLARVGYERILETQNPEIAMKRVIAAYRAQGRDDDWIDMRVKALFTRQELTSEWARRGVQGQEYAFLTDVISVETFDVKTAQHKAVKNLGKGHNLRDHMTDLELLFTALGERSTAEIARVRDAFGYRENETAAHSGGRIAGDARRNLEDQIGERVVSKSNFLPPHEGKQDQLGQ